MDGLIGELGENHGEADHIQIERQVGEIEIDVEVAIPVSLITTELITNAFKYAFPNGQDGTVTIQAMAQDETMVQLTVVDDGVGVPENLDPFHIDSLGMQLIYGLTEQIGGTVRYSRGGGDLRRPGTIITVRFPRRVSGPVQGDNSSDL